MRDDSSSGKPIGGGTRLGAFYAWVLKVFPGDLRRNHQIEMVDIAENLIAQRRAERGRMASHILAVRAVFDALVQGLGERTRRGLESFRMHVLMENLTTDIRLAWRGLIKTPAQTAVLIGTLALGIGSTSAIFSVLKGVLFSPLPYQDPHELIVIQHRASNIVGARAASPGLPDLLDYLSASSIDMVGAIQALETNLNDDDGATRITFGWTTPDFFRLLGTSAALGRAPQPTDWVGADRARMEDPSFTPPPVAVALSHRLWSSRFNQDPNILGRSLRINGQTMTVIGVLPQTFRLYMPPDNGIPPVLDAYALMPVPMSDMSRGIGGPRAIARLADGFSIEQAQTELEAILQTLRRDHEVHARSGTEVFVQALHGQVVAQARPLLWIVFGTVTLLLFIACTNVANLLLVRASTREQEFSIRSALGGKRSRIVGQLLTEGLVIGWLGTTIGITLGYSLLAALLTMRPDGIPLLDAVTLDGFVLTVAVCASVVVALAFGLAPAILSTRADGRSLVSGRSAGTGERASVRVRTILIVGQLAVSVILLVGTGLLVRTFVALSHVELGIQPEGVVAVDVAVPFFAYRNDVERSQFFVRLAAAASELPGVEVAGMSPRLPLEPGSGGVWVAPFGPNAAAVQVEGAATAQYRSVTPGALDALGVRIRSGRMFTAEDERVDAFPSVVVDRAFEETHYPRGAVGETIGVSIAAYTGSGRTVEARIVGVIEPIRFTTLTDPDDPTIFVPYRYFAPVDGSLILLTNAAPADVATSVAAIIRTLDANVPVFSPRSLASVVTDATQQTRYALFLLGVFAVIAVLLAAVGLYGVIATLVQQRTREIGLRVALGAQSHNIRHMIGQDGIRIVLPGIALGLVGAVLMGPAIQSLTYQVKPTDPVTLATTAVLLAAVSLVASMSPVRRAIRIDPVRALRGD